MTSLCSSKQASFRKQFISMCRFTMCVNIQGAGGGGGGGGRQEAEEKEKEGRSSETSVKRLAFKFLER